MNGSSRIAAETSSIPPYKPVNIAGMLFRKAKTITDTAISAIEQEGKAIATSVVQKDIPSVDLITPEIGVELGSQLSHTSPLSNTNAMYERFVSRIPWSRRSLIPIAILAILVTAVVAFLLLRRYLHSSKTSSNPNDEFSEPNKVLIYQDSHLDRKPKNIAVDSESRSKSPNRMQQPLEMLKFELRQYKKWRNYKKLYPYVAHVEPFWDKPIESFRGRVNRADFGTQATDLTNEGSSSSEVVKRDIATSPIDESKEERSVSRMFPEGEFVYSSSSEDESNSPTQLPSSEVRSDSDCKREDSKSPLAESRASPGRRRAKRTTSYQPLPVGESRGEPSLKRAMSDQARSRGTPHPDWSEAQKLYLRKKDEQLPEDCKDWISARHMAFGVKEEGGDVRSGRDKKLYGYIIRAMREQVVGGGHKQKDDTIWVKLGHANNVYQRALEYEQVELNRLADGERARQQQK